MIFSGHCLVLEKFVFLSCLCVVFVVSLMYDKRMFYLTVMRCCIVCLSTQYFCFSVSRVTLKVMDSCVS